MRKPIDGQALGIMAVLCAIWGFQQIAIKAAGPDIAPTLQMALRSGIAALLVAILMAWRGESLNLARGPWKPGLFIAVLFALEFLFIGEGLRHTTASHMSVFLYTAPFFAAIGLHWRLPEEKLRPLQWVGIALAFIGIVVAFFGPDSHQNPQTARDMLLGDFFAVLAGAAWGFTTVVIRCTSLSDTPPSKTLLYQLLGAFVLLLIATNLMGQTQMRITPVAVGSVLFQAVVVSFITYLSWFWMLRRYLAAQLGVFSFMTPLFGIVFGAWILDETIDPSFLLGALLVAVGIVFVSGHRWLGQWMGRLQAQRKT